MDTSHTPDFFHLLWGAVAALGAKLWATKAEEVKELKNKLGEVEKVMVEHSTTLATHGALHINVASAITDLKAALQANTDETRRMADTLARVETILTHSVKGIKDV